jgi:hypothetical protein
VDTQHLIHCYDRAARLAADAATAYLEHLKNPDFSMANVFTYQWHSDHNLAVSHLAAADRDYMEGVLATGGGQRQLLQKARSDYQQAIRDSRIVMYKWFTPDEALAQLGVKKMDVGNLSDAQLENLSNGIHRLMIMHSASTMNGAEDRMDYERFVARAQGRMAEIDQALTRG